MKKIDDMAKEKESEHQVFDPPVNTSITCGCCERITYNTISNKKKGCR